MEAGDAAHFGAASRQIQHTHPTEAESHGRDAAASTSGSPLTAGERRGDAAGEQSAILHEGSDQRRALLVGCAALAFAEHVEREGRESVPGEPPRFALHELAAPAPIVGDQQTRQRSGTRVVMAEEAFEKGRAVAVLDQPLANRHGRSFGWRHGAARGRGF